VRSRSVTLLVFGVLIIAGIHLYRLVQVVLQWQFLSGLLPGLAPYQAISGLVWSLTGFPLAWGLWRGKARAFRLTPWAVIAFTLYAWADRLFLRRGSGLTSVPFELGITVIILLVVFWILSRPQVKDYFHE
jgi:hypothetical protein